MIQFWPVFKNKPFKKRFVSVPRSNKECCEAQLKFIEIKRSPYHGLLRKKSSFLVNDGAAYRP